MEKSVIDKKITIKNCSTKNTQKLFDIGYFVVPVKEYQDGKIVDNILIGIIEK